MMRPDERSPRGYEGIAELYADPISGASLEPSLRYGCRVELRCHFARNAVQVPVIERSTHAPFENVTGDVNRPLIRTDKKIEASVIFPADEHQMKMPAPWIGVEE